jgi:hypothetical protein
MSDPKLWFTIFDFYDFLNELNSPGSYISKYFYVDFEPNCPFIVLFSIAVLFALLEWWWCYSGENFITFTL